MKAPVTYSASKLSKTSHRLDVFVCRAGLRGGQRGQLPRAPRCKGAPRDDEICLFQIKYSFEKFS